MNILRLLLVATVTMSLGTVPSYADNGAQVKTLDGRETTLAEHIDGGKWTLVMVWSTYCSLCKEQYPVMSEFNDRHKDKDAKVIGISVDGYDEMEKVRQYVKKSTMSFDNLIAEASTIASIYENATEESFTGTPTYLMFNPKRQVAAYNAGQLSLEKIETYIRENSE